MKLIIQYAASSKRSMYNQINDLRNDVTGKSCLIQSTAWKEKLWDCNNFVTSQSNAITKLFSELSMSNINKIIHINSKTENYLLHFLKFHTFMHMLFISKCKHSDWKGWYCMYLHGILVLLGLQTRMGKLHHLPTQSRIGKFTFSVKNLDRKIRDSSVPCQ